MLPRALQSCQDSAAESYDPPLGEIDGELELESLPEHIRRVIASAPPLSAADADRLRALLPVPAPAVPAVTRTAA